MVILLTVRRIAAHQILQLLNEQVRKWGIDIRELTLSDPKVKQVMILNLGYLESSSSCAR